MVRFQNSARTIMLAGGGLALAPVLMVYGVLARFQHGVSPANDLFGHMDRYLVQAEIGGAVLATGIVLRLIGVASSHKR
ncbi:hypothetical protein PQU92_10040 [Asticcacaulis sp. BYS171W]|uniref:Uncharacterized protein n=1 Tax=Asticcacaulis aquaticus TaxID=2984212 RepID=A0ABT5HUJ1_9CAUL|nr:hypothetical protein [Asticcacaulis aquaticus]MDC7683618.1 hypothetical protein [Asticcacaulis aquaticus]